MFYDIINNIAEWIIAGLFHIECQRVDGDGVIFLVRVEIIPKIKKNQYCIIFQIWVECKCTNNHAIGLNGKQYKFTKMKLNF